MTGSTGFRPALRLEGADLHALTRLVAAGHGLALLPCSAATGVPGTVAVPLTAPRVVHRTELVHGGALRGAAATLGERLRDPAPETTG